MPETRTDPAPHDPPPYDPSDQRDVGTGKDFAADLFALHRAGKQHFPELAAFYSGVTSATHDAAQRVHHLRSSTGGEYALTLVDELRELLHVELRRTSLAMSETGAALVEIADDYSTTDQTANDHFRTLLERRADQIEVPFVPTPPGLDAPYSTEYDPTPPDDVPSPLPPTSPHLPPPDRDLDDLVPEEPTQEHAPRPEQELPFLFPEGYESPAPEPVPEPEPPFDPPGPFDDPELHDGENELHLDDLVETPEERFDRLHGDGDHYGLGGGR
jgi:hypothetical protein